MWYGFRMSSDYPNGKRNVSHHIFPSSTRRHNARVGTLPSDYLHIRVPTDDTLTTTFYVKTVTKPSGPYENKCRGLKKTVRGVYDRVEDEWWGIESGDQDRAAQESQGLINDRSREFLATSDRGVVMWRKLVFSSIESVGKGEDPYGLLRGPDAGELIQFDAGKNFTDHEKEFTKAS
jgi:5,5'-dehydrodivanillate O-demethylase